MPRYDSEEEAYEAGFNDGGIFHRDLIRKQREALRDVLGARLGAQGSFAELGTERTEEILLLLLSQGVTIKAHQRVWTIPIPAELMDRARAAGGKTLAEWEAERAAKAEG